MKKRIIICLYIIALLVFLKLLVSYLYNEHLNKNYYQGDYNSFYDMLTYLNFPESYIAYYNNGNVYYRREEYGKAADLYRKALDSNPRHYEGKMDECDVRINLALAMVRGLGDDYNIPEKKEESLSVLYEARDVLLEDGCATENDDGHSQKAERLKKEIEKMIEELENENQDNGDGSDGDQNAQNNGGGSNQGQGEGSGSGQGNQGSGQGEGNGDDSGSGNSGQDQDNGDGDGDDKSDTEKGNGDEGNEGDDSDGDGKEDENGSNGDEDGDNKGGQDGDKDNDEGNDDGDEDGLNGGGMSPEDQAENDLRGRLMDQQEQNNREREQGMSTLDEWDNWGFNYDEEIW